MKLDTMEKEEAFRTGHLLVPPQSFLRKNWSKKFCALYKASNHGIQRLEIFDSEDNFLRQISWKIIPLTECIKVTIVPQKHQFNVFEVRTKSHTYQFSADTFHEMTEWLSSLQNVSFGSARPSSLGPQTLDGGFEKRQSIVQHEENMLYSSVDTPEIYGIKVIETEASLRCNLKGEYYLVVTSVSISIAEEASQGRIGRVLYTWPYRHIRRYGCSKDSFSFEAGRKCCSGEGLFCLIAKDASIIFKSVDTHVNSLKMTQSEIDLQASPSPNMDKNGIFFSRQSLTGSDGVQHSPPSRTKSVESDEISCYESWVPEDKSLDDGNKLSREKIDTPEEKKLSSKPPFAKPPRRSKLASEHRVASSDDSLNTSIDRQSSISCVSEHLYENPSLVEKKTFIQEHDPLYDEPEERIEAWKTHGRGIEETEVHCTDEEPEYAVLEETDEKVIAVLNNKFSQTQIASNNIVAVNSNSVANENDGYDHLALKRFQLSRYSNVPVNDKHVYGKLNTTKIGTGMASNTTVTSVVQYSNISSYGNAAAGGTDTAISEREDWHKNDRDYENVVRNEAQILFTSAEQPYELSPIHFMQNEAEYAQVLKKSNNNSK